MEHPFFPTTTNRVEALRWLSIAEKLLLTRDLVGSKSFAARARDSDPTLTPAEQILAIADTLIAGERRIVNNQVDWYGVLHLMPQQGQDSELVAGNYRSLALLLNPQKNRFPLAEEAFRLVYDAWNVLSNPSKKALYDKELAFGFQSQQQPDPYGNSIQAMHQNFFFFGAGSSGGVTVSHPPHHHGAAIHFPQVQVQASGHVVEQVVSDSQREPQNFMSFSSGSTLAFGSGIKSNHETVAEQIPERHTTFISNVAPAPVSAPVAIREQVNDAQKQAHTERVDLGAASSRNVGLSDDVVENMENVEDLGRMDDAEEVENAAENDEGSSFWTACPYCYYMYEYPNVYVDCTLKCQNCKRAFQGVVIPSPPPIVEGQESFFCCWGFLPLGYSVEDLKKNKGAAASWTPFSPMFSCPQTWNGSSGPNQKTTSAPRVYIDDDDEAFMDLSESSESDDVDWNEEIDTDDDEKMNTLKRKVATGTPKRSAKKAQSDKGKDVNLQDGLASPSGVAEPNKMAGEANKKGLATNARKQPGRVAKNCGKLDLNVEFSNEPEEPVPKVAEAPGPSRGEDDNIEGIGFFEGLDEFLSSLPILNVVADDKVVKAAQ